MTNFEEEMRKEMGELRASNAQLVELVKNIGQTDTVEIDSENSIFEREIFEQEDSEQESSEQESPEQIKDGLKWKLNSENVDVTIQARDNIWWILKGSKIRAEWAPSFVKRNNNNWWRCIEMRLKMHKDGVATLSDDRLSFVFNEDFATFGTLNTKSMGQSPVATFVYQRSSNAQGFVQVNE